MTTRRRIAPRMRSLADSVLSAGQKEALLGVYRSYVRERERGEESSA